jgi:hypothetical protein
VWHWRALSIGLRLCELPRIPILRRWVNTSMKKAGGAAPWPWGIGSATRLRGLPASAALPASCLIVLDREVMQAQELVEAAAYRLTELRGQPSRIYKVNLRDEKALRGLEAGGPGWADPALRQ